LNTVEQVLKASRAREKNIFLNIAEINLAELLVESVKRVKTRYDLSDDVISFAPSGAEKVKVSGDADELQAVFTNLLDNAVKYSSAEVKVSVVAESLDEKTVVVRIKDSGIGILPADLKRIFKRFYRVPSPQTQKMKGTGLGLFIVRSIVKKHGGRISAESRGDGTGSTFIVELPKISGSR
jgi:signal transduction histidine kinase